MAERKARTRASRKANGSKTPQVYRVPGMRVSVVRERWVRLRRRPIVRTSAGLAAALSACIPADDAREHFVMAILDVRNRLLGVHTVSIGCLTGTLVHPREVLRIAVLMGACTIGVAHNHSSGTLEPSKEDVELTRRLMACVELLGIRFADHVIFGRDGRWLSMREKGYLAAPQPAPAPAQPMAGAGATVAPAPPMPQTASGS